MTTTICYLQYEKKLIFEYVHLSPIKYQKFYEFPTMYMIPDKYLHPAYSHVVLAFKLVGETSNTRMFLMNPFSCGVYMIAVLSYKLFIKSLLNENIEEITDFKGKKIVTGTS